MKELSNETPVSRAPAWEHERVQTPAPEEEHRDSPPGVFVFDGWTMVPIDLHAR